MADLPSGHSLTMPGKPSGALVTISVSWAGDMSRTPQPDDVFATRTRLGEISSVYHVQEVHGGPTYYRVVCIKLDPYSWEGDLDWELVWNSRD